MKNGELLGVEIKEKQNDNVIYGRNHTPSKRRDSVLAKLHQKQVDIKRQNHVPVTGV